MDTNGSIFSKIKFEPTINLGHVVSAGSFLFALGMAWASLDGKVERHQALNVVQFATVDKKNIEQDITIKEIAAELKAEIRSNTMEIKQELRDMRRR